MSSPPLSHTRGPNSTSVPSACWRKCLCGPNAAVGSKPGSAIADPTTAPSSATELTKTTRSSRILDSPLGQDNLASSTTFHTACNKVNEPKSFHRPRPRSVPTSGEGRGRVSPVLRSRARSTGRSRPVAVRSASRIATSAGACTSLRRGRSFEPRSSRAMATSVIGAAAERSPPTGVGAWLPLALQRKTKSAPIAAHESRLASRCEGSSCLPCQFSENSHPLTDCDRDQHAEPDRGKRPRRKRSLEQQTPTQTSVPWFE